MDLRTFKKMLETYGADFSRWDGVDENEAKSFMETSPDAQKLQMQAMKLDKALDEFTVEPPRHSIIGGINSRIADDSVGEAQVMPFPLRIDTPPWKIVAGISMAAAALVVLIVSTTMDSSVKSMAPAVEPVAQKSIAIAELSRSNDQVEAFVSEMASLMSEDIEAEEIIGILDVAQAVVPEEDVDGFLNELFAEDEQSILSDLDVSKEEDAAADDEAIWDMFYPDDSVQ